MSKTTIGIIFILAGLCYGSLVFDPIYNRTLGYLINNDWVGRPPEQKLRQQDLLGRKPTIILYSLILISIGIFLIWNHKE